MLRLIFVFLLAGTSIRAWAEELAIVDIRRNITLADDDPVYKDFYINAGDSSAALKKNLVVTAVRKIAIRDASGSQAYGEILVPVGQLRIIAIYGRVAVAREYKLLSRDDLPMLEQIGIMTGDRVDLQGAFVDNSKPKPKKVSSNESSPAITASVTVMTGPAPASVPPATVVAAATPVTTTTVSPAPKPEAAPAEKAPHLPASDEPAPQKLEKTADSGNKSDL